MSAVGGQVRGLVAAARPRQWVKNLLLGVGPLAAGSLTRPEALVPLGFAFLAFSAAASALYLLNDVWDADRDREHPVKRTRPVAAGALPRATAVTTALLLGLAALVLAWSTLPRPFTLVLAAYVVTSSAYSAGLKDLAVIDLALVASGFVLRVLGGGVATGVRLSPWLVMTVAFASLFVVAGKRASELALVGDGQVATRATLAAYSDGFLRFVWIASSTVAIAAVAVWASEVAVTFARPNYAGASVAPFTLAVLRYGWWIDRGEAEAPEEVLLRDPVLIVLGVVWVGLFLVGIGRVA